MVYLYFANPINNHIILMLLNKTVILFATVFCLIGIGHVQEGGVHILGTILLKQTNKQKTGLIFKKTFYLNGCVSP